MNSKGLRFLALILMAISLASCGEKRDQAHRPSEIKWVDPSTLRPSPIQHETLPVDLVDRITAVKKTFAEIDPTPIEKWIEDFRRDANPEREVKVWESMAAAYVRYTGEHPCSQEQKKELFGILLVGSGAPTDEVVKRLKLKEFSETQAREVLGILAAEWKKKASPTTESSRP
jgi:hypothetical protein